MLQIITEGDDEFFIRSYLEHKFEKIYDEDFTITPSKGWTKLSLLAPKIREFHDAGDKILIVFDADSPNNHGGYSKRLEEIHKIVNEISELQSFKTAIDVFLFPNNKDDGDFEIMLENIVAEKGRFVFDCFEKYVQCIRYESAAKSIDCSLPLKKAKIFAYHECFSDTKKIGGYRKPQYSLKYWDLDSEYLNELMYFFNKHF